MITPRPVGAGSTTIPRAALRAPDLFLTATVAAFILATFLVSAVPGLSRLPHLIIGLMIVGFIIRSIRIPLTFAFDGVAPLAVAFVAYAFASVLWSTDQSSALVSAIGLTVDLMGALLIWAALQNGVKGAVIAYSAAVGAGIQALVALTEYLSSGTSRAQGLTGNANSLAIQLSLTAFLLLLLLPRDRWIKVFAFALIIVATITTGTRKLVFVWFSYILLLLHEVSPMFRRPSFGAAVVLLLSPLAVWASLTYGQTLLSPFEEVTLIQRLEGTLEGRETRKRSGLMEDALAVWQRKPVFGHGIDQYRFSGSYTTYSHNNYTEVLANFGVVGILVFYGIYLVLAVRSLIGISQGSRTAWVILAILISIVLMDLARVSYSSRMTWIFIMIMAFYSSGFTIRRMSGNSVGKSTAEPGTAVVPVRNA